MVMKAIKIAELKSHLSQHLRTVRAGEILTVLDRTTPVARVVPLDSGDDVVVTRPAAGSPPIGRIPLPASMKINVDVVALLLAERRRGR